MSRPTGAGQKLAGDLEKFSTLELVDYYIKTLGYEDNLRNYLEEKITADEINKSKMKNVIDYKEEEQELLW